MKTLLALIFSIFLAIPAQAGCIGGEPFSTHKAMHFAGNAALAGFVFKETRSEWAAYGAAFAVSAAREVYKQRRAPEMRCEYSSMAWDAAGAIAGVGITKAFFIVPENHGVSIHYYRSF